MIKPNVVGCFDIYGDDLDRAVANLSAKWTVVRYRVNLKKLFESASSKASVEQ